MARERERESGREREREGERGRETETEREREIERERERAREGEREKERERERGPHRVRKRLASGRGKLAAGIAEMCAASCNTAQIVFGVLSSCGPGVGLSGVCVVFDILC